MSTQLTPNFFAVFQRFFSFMYCYIHLPWIIARYYTIYILPFSMELGSIFRRIFDFILLLLDSFVIQVIWAKARFAWPKFNYFIEWAFLLYSQSLWNFLMWTLPNNVAINTSSQRWTLIFRMGKFWDDHYSIGIMSVLTTFI